MFVLIDYLEIMETNRVRFPRGPEDYSQGSTPGEGGGGGGGVHSPRPGSSGPGKGLAGFPSLGKNYFRKELDFKGQFMERCVAEDPSLFWNSFKGRASQNRE
jgi:hypothetical protein